MWQVFATSRRLFGVKLVRANLAKAKDAKLPGYMTQVICQRGCLRFFRSGVALICLFKLKAAV